MAHSKHWIVPGALVLAAVGFAALGRWQLERAAANRAIEAGFERAARLPALEAPVAAHAAEALRHRRIRLTGRYEPEVQILLDNMTHGGRVGYQVLTPFDAGGERLVLVNRGFVPATTDRSRLPDVSLANRSAEVTGRVDRLPRAALELAPPPVEPGTRLAVLSFPDYEDIEAVLGRGVFRFQLKLDPDRAHGFERDWRPDGGRDERNIAYAVQWFALAGLALAIAAGIVFRRLRRMPDAGA